MPKPGWSQLLVRPHIHRKIKVFATMDGVLLHEYVEAVLLEHIDRRGVAEPRDDRLDDRRRYRSARAHRPRAK